MSPFITRPVSFNNVIRGPLSYIDRSMISKFAFVHSRRKGGGWEKNSCRRVDRSEELRTESLHKALFGFYLPFLSSLVRAPVERDTLLVSLLAKQRGLHLRYPPTRRGPRSPTDQRHDETREALAHSTRRVHIGTTQAFSAPPKANLP